MINKILPFFFILGCSRPIVEVPVEIHIPPETKNYAVQLSEVSKEKQLIIDITTYLKPAYKISIFDIASFKFKDYHIINPISSQLEMDDNDPWKCYVSGSDPFKYHHLMKVSCFHLDGTEIDTHPIICGEEYIHDEYTISYQDINKKIEVNLHCLIK